MICKLRLLTCPIVLCLAAWPALVRGQDVAPEANSGVGDNTPLNLVYKLHWHDLKTREFRAAESEAERISLERRLNSGMISASRAAAGFSQAARDLKPEIDRDFTLHIIAEGSDIYLASREGDSKTLAIISGGHTIAADESVTYVANRVTSSHFSELPPLPFDVGPLALIKSRQQLSDDQSSCLYMLPGTSGGEGDGSYIASTLKSVVNGAKRQITAITVGNATNPIQTINYGTFREVGGKSIPLSIRRRSYGSIPDVVNSSAAVDESEFILVSASTSVPSGTFDTSKYLKVGELVQYDNGVAESSFDYTASKTLDEQLMTSVNETQNTKYEDMREEYARRKNGSVVLSLAGLLLLGYWFKQKIRTTRRTV